MISLAILWDVIKVLIFPVVGLLYAMFKQKITKLDEQIEKLEQKNLDLERTVIRMEGTFVTQEQLQELFRELIMGMEKGNDTLERRLEKTMDLKIDPIKGMLEKLVDRHNNDKYR